MARCIKALFIGLFFLTNIAISFAAPKSIHERIIFIPHDNRPISNEQTADTLRKLGWEVITPPEEILGSRESLGQPELVWQWLFQNVNRANAVVVSSDTLLYGSLVGSRKHNYSENEIFARVEKFNELKMFSPNSKVYVFGSIMRTPRSGEASGLMEPSYYANYGSDIFRYTALFDKAEVEGLTRREKKEFDFLKRLIPKEALDDWLDRRNKNFITNKKLIDLVQKEVIEYLALGRDDNAPFSQTHMESRKLEEYGAQIGDTRFQAMAGIDEFGMLMLTRAVNDITQIKPFVFVRYNWGRGANTIPAYSDEVISESIRDHIVATGGIVVSNIESADVVLAVNTNPNGKTLESNSYQNKSLPRVGTEYFVDFVQEYVNSGYPVCIADVAFSNGADNALMEMLKNKGLLFKIRAYAAWNTATNSTGFVISQGMLSAKMTDDVRDELLLMRYLDDWVYQANIRPIMGRQLGWLRGTGVYATLNEKRVAVADRTASLMRRFCEDNLPPFEGLTHLTVTFPWNRMFEARFDLSTKYVLKKYTNKGE